MDIFWSKDLEKRGGRGGGQRALVFVWRVVNYGPSFETLVGFETAAYIRHVHIMEPCFGVLTFFAFVRLLWEMNNLITLALETLETEDVTLM